jgi:hypothetical protein
MSKPLTEADLEVLSYLLKGNRDAIRLCLDTIYVGQLWDDMVDQDNERTVDEINSAFLKAFRNIPNNAWFNSLPDRYRYQLEGLLISAAMQYKDSTHLEMGDSDDRFTAFMIRNAVLALIHYVVGLVGGEDWIDENGLLFWRTFSLKGEYLQFVMEGSDAEI